MVRVLTSPGAFNRKSRRSKPFTLVSFVRRRLLCILILLAWANVMGFFLYVMWYVRVINQGGQYPQPNQQQQQQQWLSQNDAPVLVGSALPQQYKSHHGVINASPIEMQDRIAADPKKYESPLLVFTCNRPEYLTKTLEYIEQAMLIAGMADGDICHFGCPVIVSQDAENEMVTQVIQKFQQTWNLKGIPLVHIKHPPANLRGAARAYAALAQHYGWALTKVFNGGIPVSMSASFPTPKRVIILEEDLQISQDFFPYFQAMAPLLDRDPNLLAVSAYNDNGQREPIKSKTDTSRYSSTSAHGRALRSDFFPGLGWMMTRNLWKSELESKWPSSYWDDWLREPAQRKGRQIIRPEVSRTYHFGAEGGASKNQFGALLQAVQLNDEYIDWTKHDLTLLRDDMYKQQYGELIKSATLVHSLEEVEDKIPTQNVRLEYKDFKDFQRLARRIHITDDEKAMVPRTAYYGVVETRLHGEYILFLTPPTDTLRQDLPNVV